MKELTQELVAVVYMNWGMWVADCPRLGCANAEHFGKHPVSGHRGGLHGEDFVCGSLHGGVNGCGLRVRALWPERLEEIEQLLLMRPAPGTRNWRPGESWADLLAENIQHGVMSAGNAFAFVVGGPKEMARLMLTGGAE